MRGPAPTTPERPYVFLVRLSGELSIKAKGTRQRFTSRLVANLEDALASSGIDFELARTWSRLFVTASSPEADAALARVFGVSSVSRVEHRTWESLDDVVRHGEEIFAPRIAGKRFAVRARRVEPQQIPFRSADVDRELGTRLLPHAARVDLGSPEVTAYVELHAGQAYFFCDSVPGPDGLPLGRGGRAVALVSGGFDSVVASWLLLRRGVELEYVFCHLGGAPHRDGTLAVIKVLADRWSYGVRPRLHMVDFQPLVAELEERCPQALWQVVLKRQMLRAADQVARAVGAAAIVTGESVGQVSSQTLQNLAVISRATDLPVLRPLCGTNKEEIFVYARRIGTFDLSAKVPEYCALTRDHPATHASFKRVNEAEARLELGHVRLQARERMTLDLRALDLGRAAATSCEVESVPDGAVVVDLRSPEAFRGWHYPQAQRLDYFEALKTWPQLDRGRIYVFYCEVGIKSAHLAEVMREAGFESYHLKDGLKTLRRWLDGQDPALKAVLSPALLD
jgi:thiamine biosynthesis protein ThiI